jgi:hypothetical protein
VLLLLFDGLPFPRVEEVIVTLSSLSGEVNVKSFLLLPFDVLEEFATLPRETRGAGGLRVEALLAGAGAPLVGAGGLAIGGWLFLLFFLDIVGF